MQLAQRKILRRKVLHWLLIALCAGIVVVSAALFFISSPYLGWDSSALETAVMGVAFHAFEWLFVRLAPMILMAAIVGVCLTRSQA